MPRPPLSPPDQLPPPIAVASGAAVTVTWQASTAQDVQRLRPVALRGRPAGRAPSASPRTHWRPPSPDLCRAVSTRSGSRRPTPRASHRSPRHRLPVTLGMPPSAPGQATVVAGVGQASATWLPSPSDEGSPVTGYVATAARRCAMHRRAAGNRVCADRAHRRPGVHGDGAGPKQCGLSAPSPASGTLRAADAGSGAVTITFDGAIGTEVGAMRVTASGGGLKALTQATFTVFSTRRSWVQRRSG